jgi:calcineurin-like phosphoesterase family protein
VKQLNYYISNIHFGCQNKFENRTLEHDQLIIDNWNHTVTNSDTVYILGDIGRIGSNKDNEYLCKCISVLKGKKVLVLGNHDDYLKDIRLRQLFTEVCDYKEITDNYNGMSHKLVLQHYPILMWNGQHKGWVHIYGHVHMSDEWDVYKHSLKYLNDFFKDKTLKGYRDCPEAKAYNVGAVLLGWTPRTLKEIIALNDAFDTK